MANPRRAPAAGCTPRAWWARVASGPEAALWLGAARPGRTWRRGGRRATPAEPRRWGGRRRAPAMQRRTGHGVGVTVERTAAASAPRLRRGCRRRARTSSRPARPSATLRQRRARSRGVPRRAWPTPSPPVARSWPGASPGGRSRARSAPSSPIAVGAKPSPSASGPGSRGRDGDRCRGRHWPIPRGSGPGSWAAVSANPVGARPPRTGPTVRAGAPAAWPPASTPG
jgi:hypothetical protein